ncbi:MAG: polysaccharide biosynthesis/export family protein [Bacteroidota bacterium]
MNLRNATNNLKGITISLILAGCLLAVTGCNKRTRNVLFNTPKQFQKMGLAVVHLNPYSVYIADSMAIADSLNRVAALARGDSSVLEIPPFERNNYEHRIQPDDRIALRFLNNFDISSGVTITKQGGAENGITFLVDREGFVSLPMLGRVYVKGKTKQEAQVMLERRYSENFKNPSVEVSLVSLSVSVQGEVRNPGIYELARERTSLLEVLAAAGGVTQYAKKRVIKVVRGVAQNQEPEILIFDLRKLDAIETTDMILRDKDVVYVEPRDIRVVADAVAPYSSFLAILSTVSTITVVAINVVSR